MILQLSMVKYVYLFKNIYKQFSIIKMVFFWKKQKKQLIIANKWLNNETEIIYKIVLLLNSKLF